MRLKSMLVLVALVMIFGVAPAHAAVVFDNGTYPNSNVNVGWYSSDANNWRVYDNFSLTHNETIDSVWMQYGITSGTTLSSFTFTVYNENAGKPSGSIYTQTLTTSDYNAVLSGYTTIGDYPYYTITFDLSSSLNLVTGNYWLSFYGIGDTHFRALNTGSGNGFYQYDELHGILYARGGDTPFRLERSDPESTVPEPASMALLGSGLVGLIGLKRKK